MEENHPRGYGSHGQVSANRGGAQGEETYIKHHGLCVVVCMFFLIHIFVLFPLVGVSKLSETEGLWSDQRPGCVQGSAVLYADPGLGLTVVSFRLFLLKLQGHQVFTSCTGGPYTQFPMYTL